MIRVAVVAALALCATLAVPAAGQEAQKAVPSAGATAQDEAVVGTVQTLKGSAYIVRGGQRLSAGRGTKIYQQDVIRTEKGGAVGLVLRDETAVSLGPSSELAVREFIYKPSEGVFSSVLSFVRGTMVYIAGRIAKLAPASMRVETPVGVAAARGTKFLVAVPE